MTIKKFTASRAILLSSLPQALRKIGDDKLLKLCTSTKYRKHRRFIPKCSHCGSKNVRFRSTTRDYKCCNPNCKKLTPAKSRVAIVGSTVASCLFSEQNRGGDYALFDNEVLSK